VTNIPPEIYNALLWANAKGAAGILLAIGGPFVIAMVALLLLGSRR
jgi:hypothetical protein